MRKAEREDKERKARYQERQDNDARRAAAETTEAPAASEEPDAEATDTEE